MKRFFCLTILVGFLFVLGGCSDSTVTLNPVPDSIFILDRVYIDGVGVDADETAFATSTLQFLNNESADTVLIRIGENTTSFIARINPSREHPSFEQGYWHHHLYSGATTPGSPRINFMELLPELGIDDNPDATDNTQSLYQRGNLHYVVATGEFRLMLRINGELNELFFVPVQ